jgi:hypothetical protein
MAMAENVVSGSTYLAAEPTRSRECARTLSRQPCAVETVVQPVMVGRFRHVCALAPASQLPYPEVWTIW